MGSIAFAADLDGDWSFEEGDADSFVLDLETGAIRNLTDHPANDFSPDWSPDGSRIAFRTDRDGNHEIYVMNADGSDPVNLTRSRAEERSPVWSPDGSRIAFASDRGGEFDIFVIDADGGNVTRLPHEGPDEYPTWSPDGTRLAFTSFCRTCTVAQLWVMPAKGGEATPLAPTAGWPDWSPDGDAIAFDRLGVGGEVVAIMHLDGEAGSEPVVTGFQPEWSPDGAFLVFARAVGRTTDLFLSAANGSGVRRLTSTPRAFEFEPVWASG
jgi:tol-pal system beta propeller repeat protein TolB